MTDNKSETKSPVSTSTEAQAAPVSDYAILLANVHHDLSLLNQAVQLLEPRFTTRALRSLPQLRLKLGTKQVPGENLAHVLRTGNLYPENSDRLTQLLDLLGNPAAPKLDQAAPASAGERAAAGDSTMQIDSASTSAPAASTSTSTEPAVSTSTINEQDKEKVKEKEREHKRELAKKKKLQEELHEIAAKLPEADCFVSLLVLISLLDRGEYEKGKLFSTELIEKFSALNRRTLDQLMSKVYFYWVRLHELSGDDTSALRPTLLAAQRTASLRHDDDLQATLLPLLLRNYLEHGLYEQADRLVSKTTFPEGTAQNSQLARWYYYVGRIRAIQLDYSAANASLLQSIRRAPSDLKAAPGFFQHAYKLSVVVELLMGEIPERRIFREEVLRKTLKPYLEIAQAVRIGDIHAFDAALSKHSQQFKADNLLTLVTRLRHNVIKTALRTISLSYSRISLSDVAHKLSLDSEEDAEYIVAKAIRDGVVVAQVDHERGEMTSKDVGDVYSTGEPLKEFDRRIQFLLELRNQSVKAMRYPLNAHSKDLKAAQEAREEEKRFAKEIEEGDDDDLDGGDMDF
ncbi:proteasome regulatory particle lid subunit RPN3 [Sporobolomyces koalae]|uniref:proteasome regulatory particle lid subunit RPN3 n=1 Tax=Sporobolomyces koalae TaxID=500713 RepID=UPI00317BA5BB